MPFHLDRDERLADLVDQLRTSENVTAGLLSTIVTTACARFSTSDHTRTAQISKLIEAGAWVDAALVLVENELPQWRLRRLIYDEGQWHCALSRQRELPEWLDQAVETSHADCSLAVLQGFIEAVRQNATSNNAGATRIPRIPLRQHELICCENFA
jgi:hypothetical protein